MIIQERTFRGHPYKIACYDDTPQHPSWFSFEDESNVRDRDWLIEPGDMVLDVGAAYGSYALTALACGAGYVWAWSPQGSPEGTEADTLRASLKLNGWAHKGTVYDSGVYSSCGWLDTNRQELLPPEGQPRDESVIEVEPLDDWFRRTFDQADPESYSIKGRYWMKLDVEGAECEVIRGGANLIKALRPIILVENHLFKRNTIADEVREILVGEFGYRELGTHPYHSISHSVYLP
jgi:FkbM family methyltransferase